MTRRTPNRSQALTGLAKLTGLRTVLTLRGKWPPSEADMDGLARSYGLAPSVVYAEVAAEDRKRKSGESRA